MKDPRKLLKPIIDRVLPKHSQRRRIAKKMYLNLKTKKGNIDLFSDYNRWITQNEPELWEKVPKESAKVLISVVVPVFNTPNKYIIPLIDSLVSQTYPNWQLCLADGSTDDERAATIKALAEKDDRISYERIEQNLGISANTNVGLRMAKGPYIGLLDHDDLLSPHALEEVALAIARTDAEIIYSDEDKLSDDGKERISHFFKPDWSPDLLNGVNYITHFLVVKKELVEKVGGLRSEFDGAQDYDFLLRITELTDKIYHIPKILYHWRLADGSTSKTVGEKNYADTAGQRALGEAIKRRKIDAEVVEIPERPTNYRLRYNLPKQQPLVSIIIPFKDKADLLDTCVESIISKTTYKNYEIILVSNNSIEDETEKLLKKLSKNKRCKVFYWDHRFNYSKINNYGALQAKGKYLVLLNNDTEVITPEWLNELIGVASQPGVGAVGPMLLYPERKNGIQHAGIIVGMMSMAGHVFRHQQPGSWTLFGIPSWPRNYLAVTGACLAVNKKLYDEMGGLDEIFTVAGQDVAFGIKLHEAGYRNVYWPSVSLYHYESISVGSYDTGIQLDYDHSLTYYKKYHEQGDPYFNPNLDLMNEQIVIRSTYEKTFK
jgi:glycosyltransferase involved in cell wall biosynthesis